MSNHTDNIGYCNNTATSIENKGVKYYDSTATSAERSEEHNTLAECLNTVETDFRMGELGEERTEILNVNFKRAQLIIAGGDYLAVGPNGPIASQYPEDVLEIIVGFSDFRQYDVYEWDDEFFQRALAHGDEELYEFIEEKLIPQWER